MNKSGPSMLVIVLSVFAGGGAQIAYIANHKHQYHLAGFALYFAVVFSLYAIHAAIERTRDR
jgi:hypothetical protein